MTRHVHLVGFLKPAGEYPAGWRHPASPDAAGTDFGFVAAQAQRLETARFDAVFVPDLAGIPDVRDDVLERVAVVNDTFEPTTLLAALAAVTERIGLVGTASTSFATAAALAGDFGSLHRLSGGRAGWNVVTSLNDSEARNHGRDAHADHGDRYAHASVVVDDVLARWGLPDARPIIAQAGSSDAGRALAARIADVVFTRALPLAATRSLVDDIRDRAASHGRNPGDILVLPELATVVGRTRQEAEDAFAVVRELLDPRVALADLEYWAGVDLSHLPPSASLPPRTNRGGSRGAQREIYEQAQRDGLTIGDLALIVADGDGVLVGTAEDVADHIETFAAEAGVDGFTVSFPWLPGTLDAFVELVVPELRRRGLHRTEYEGRTIRDHLGLRRQRT